MQPSANGQDIVFYDGTCGLCHRFVKWTLRHDTEARFRFAPLQGETLQQMIPAEERAKLPDSIVVLGADGRLLVKSAAAKYVTECLSIRTWAALLGILPRWLADFGYDAFARIRYSIFGRKQEMCPLVPEGSRGRFLP